MRIKIMFVVCIFALISCKSKNDKIELNIKEEVNTVETTDTVEVEKVDTLLIHNFSVNGLQLGMPIHDAKKQLLLCDSVVLDMEAVANLEDTIFYVYYQGDMIMNYNSKDDSLITWIEVFSPVFYTKDGFRVGDNIKKFVEDSKKSIKEDSDTGYNYYRIEGRNTFSILLFFDEEDIILWIGLYDEK